MMHRPTLCLLALLATLALAACGSSSSGSSTNASSTTATTTAGGGRLGNGKMAACLRQHGVTLPNRPPGRPALGARRRGFFLGGPNASPVRRKKLQAAFQACGGRPGGFRRFSPGSNPAFKAALAKYVACVRKNGFDLPAPNTSGRGPVFDPGKVNRNDPKFVAASAKCQSLLQQGSAGGAGAPGGGPPPGA
jgi:hypothetical protein